MISNYVRKDRCLCRAINSVHSYRLPTPIQVRLQGWHVVHANVAFGSISDVGCATLLRPLLPLKRTSRPSRTIFFLRHVEWAVGEDALSSSSCLFARSTSPELGGHLGLWKAPGGATRPAGAGLGPRSARLIDGLRLAPFGYMTTGCAGILSSRNTARAAIGASEWGKHGEKQPAKMAGYRAGKPPVSFIHRQRFPSLQAQFLWALYGYQL